MKQDLSVSSPQLVIRVVQLFERSLLILDDLLKFSAQPSGRLVAPCLALAPRIYVLEGIDYPGDFILVLKLAELSEPRCAMRQHCLLRVARRHDKDEDLVVAAICCLVTEW